MISCTLNLPKRNSASVSSRLSRSQYAADSGTLVFILKLFCHAAVNQRHATNARHTLWFMIFAYVCPTSLAKNGATP